MTFKDYIVLTIKNNRVKSCPVPVLTVFSQVGVTDAAPGKNHIRTQVERACHRAQELHMSSFYDTVGLDQLSAGH